MIKQVRNRFSYKLLGLVPEPSTLKIEVPLVEIVCPWPSNHTLPADTTIGVFSVRFDVTRTRKPPVAYRQLDNFH